MDKYLKKSGASQTEDRKYKDDYIEYGFIASETEDPQTPFCVVCKKKPNLTTTDKEQLIDLRNNR